MSDISKAFSNGKAIIPYVAAGDPDVESTVKFVLALEKAGADMVQIGIPFSDPIADEPAQKDAALRGLEAGANLACAFRIVERVRETSDVPVSLVSYLNPIFGYGYKEFFARCAECSIATVFIIDMPYEERTEVSEFAEEFGIGLVSAIYPASSKRLELLADNADGFIYLVPMKATSEEVESMIATIRENTDVPITIAFGAGKPEDAKKIIGSADGLVIGSGVVEFIGAHGPDAEPEIVEYIQKIAKELD